MFKRMTAAWVLLACAAASAWAGPITKEGVENRLIVGLKQGVSLEEARQLLRARGLTVLREIAPFTPAKAGGAASLFLVEARPGFAAAAVKNLKSEAKVADVEPDLWQKWIEDAPASFQQTELPSVEQALQDLPKLARGPRSQGAEADEVRWGVKRVNAPAAWPTNQGAGAKVCIVDTGIDPNVPDLQGQVGGGQNFVDQNAPWVDDHFHGTHVSGIVAAKLDGKGVVGVAPKAKLYAAKVLTKDGQGNIFAIIQGIMWCAQNQMNVINMSLGAPQSIPFLEDVINMALQQGVTVVAAAGNGDGHGGSSPVNYPGAYKGVIAVSALDDTDNITKWSSRGPEVAFIAPGLKIPSTVPASNDPSYVHEYSGTSMASPHVAGLAALAVAKGAQGPAAVRAMLSAAAQKLPGLSSDEQGLGLINAAKLAK